MHNMVDTIEFFNNKPYLQGFGLVVEEFNLYRGYIDKPRKSDPHPLSLGPLGVGRSI
jgi:hypothetical protein